MEAQEIAMSTEDQLSHMTGLFLKATNFAREALEVAINRGDLLGDDDISEGLIEQWERLTGEVYGEDYCQR